ncbi:uncharacterized protein LOC135286342 [Passer domesticus]|uniref:uncharacterized protein LOC135286342 n=1 Tax=Passer domesticus TaxID=48849 RepID=UPI0030FE2AE8
MEPQELSPALLHPPVTVVATLGELLATLPRPDEMMLLFQFPLNLYWALEKFTKDLQTTLYRTDDTVWRRIVTSDDRDLLISLSKALAACKSTPRTAGDHEAMAAVMWQGSVSVLLDSWAELAKVATHLLDICRKVVAEAADKAAIATDWADVLQKMAASFRIGQGHGEQLGPTLVRQAGAEVLGRREARVRRNARAAASETPTVPMLRQRVEEALGLLERLVAACDGAAAFPRELQRLLRDIVDTMEGTNEASPSVPKDWVDKMAVAERLWVANARLAKDHLVGTIPDTIDFLFNGGSDRPSAREVSERCQRAIKDIPRLVQSPEHLQSVPKVSPVSVELQTLSPALLHPPVTVVATLGELLATVPTREEEMRLLKSPRCLYWDLEDFCKELRVTLYCIDDTWWRRNVTSDDDDPPTSPSQALAAYRSTPLSTWHRVTMAASEWHQLVSVLVDRWARLARAATKLHNACREVVTQAANAAATTNAWARKLRGLVAHYGIAEENRAPLGPALRRRVRDNVGYEGWVRRNARVGARQATMATMERQWVEEALGLLERLVAACDEAAAFPRELQRLLRDTEAALEGTNEASPDVPKDLVDKVAVAERLWEASTRLVKDHLLGTLQDIIDFYIDGDPASPPAFEVAERCRSAIDDIPRLLQPMECSHVVPKVSPVNTELQELSPAVLHPPVTVVAILGELLATVPTREEEMLLLMSPRCLYWNLEDFTKELRVTLYRLDGTWWRQDVTSLSRVLAACDSTTCTTWDHVTMAASKWQGSVSELVDSWARLARVATQLHKTWREVATKVADRVATATARARELQDKAARYGTLREKMLELGQALGGEEGAEVVGRHEARVKREARVAASEATMAIMERQRVEAALGLLERLVAACDEATALPQDLQCRVGDIEAALKGTNVAYPDVPKDKVTMAERLWEANVRLAKDHLVGAVDSIIEFYFSGGPDRPSACGVAERCQRAIEDIPNLLQG